jgi:hypothetical protein
LVTLVCGGKRSNQAVHEIEVCGKVIRRIPLDAANIWGSWNGGARRWEVAFNVRASVFWRLFTEDILVLGEGDDVQMVQEDPKHLLSNIGNLLAPHTVRP